MAKALGLPPDEVDKRLTAMGILTRCPTCSGHWEEWDDGREQMTIEPRRLTDVVRKALTCERGHRFPVDVLEASSG